MVTAFLVILRRRLLVLLLFLFSTTKTVRSIRQLSTSCAINEKSQLSWSLIVLQSLEMPVWTWTLPIPPLDVKMRLFELFKRKLGSCAKSLTGLMLNLAQLHSFDGTMTNSAVTPVTKMLRLHACVRSQWQLRTLYLVDFLILIGMFGQQHTFFLTFSCLIRFLNCVDFIHFWIPFVSVDIPFFLYSLFS